MKDKCKIRLADLWWEGKGITSKKHEVIKKKVYSQKEPGLGFNPLIPG